MAYSLLADFVVLLHGAFVLFAVLGGLLVLRKRYPVEAFDISGRLDYGVRTISTGRPP